MESLSGRAVADLKSALDEYCNLEKRVAERQEQWKETTKDFIFATLSALAKELKPLQAVHQKSPRNFDTVCLGFRSKPSNILLPQNGGVKGLMKTAGYLHYSQVFNGKIFVGIVYPYIEELQDAHPNKGIALLDPEQITEENILEHVADFLQEITAVEQSYSADDEAKRQRRIGFASSDT